MSEMAGQKKQGCKGIIAGLNVCGGRYVQKEENMLGYMLMPEGFRYQETARRGKPRHPIDDVFWLRHPQMKPEKRAKIFSPFDALKGLREEMESVERSDSK